MVRTDDDLGEEDKDKGPESEETANLGARWSGRNLGRDRANKLSPGRDRAHKQCALTASHVTRPLRTRARISAAAATAFVFVIYFRPETLCCSPLFTVKMSK